MQTLRWKQVRLIFSREVRDQLRDRRTLFMIAVLPLLLYPLMGMSFMQLAQFLKKHPSQILLVAEAPLPTNPPLLDGRHPVDLSAHDAQLVDVEVRVADLPDARRAAEQATTIIESGSHDMVVCFPRGFIRRIEQQTEGGRAAANAAEDATQTEPLIYYNAAKDRSRIAYERMTFVLNQWRRRLQPPESPAVEASPLPFTLTAQDIAEPVGRRAAIWSKILPFVALVWALTGAFYPAVDLCAGEKERGTLETLLSSPADRTEIVFGKLLTVMLFSFSTAVLNLLCMLVTATFTLAQFQNVVPEGQSLVLGAPPLFSIGWLVLALVPIVALFSALALALATMARSTREGQYYLMPLLLITMPLMLLSLFPAAELDLGSSLIPITGVMLLLRQLMEAEYRTALLYATPVLTVTLGCGWMAIRWAVDQFNNEEVLFRESERFDLSLWLRHLFRDRSPTPSVGEALMCGILILLIRFFASLSLPLAAGLGTVRRLDLRIVGGLRGDAAIIMSIMLTTRPTETLLLHPPQVWKTVPAAALLALFLHPVATAVTVIVRVLYPLDPEALAPLEGVMRQAPGLFPMVLLMAVMPAICEEIAFRGYILSGLRHLGNRWRAIFISSLLFGLAHGVFQQSVTALLFGLILGYLAVKTRSLLPCVVFHAVHNSLGLAAAQWLSQPPQAPWVDWIFTSVHDTTTGTEIVYYGAPVLLLAFCAAAVVLNWFRSLPHVPTDEERLKSTIDQRLSAATA